MVDAAHWIAGVLVQDLAASVSLLADHPDGASRLTVVPASLLAEVRVVVRTDFDTTFRTLTDLCESLDPPPTAAYLFVDESLTSANITRVGPIKGLGDAVLGAASSDAPLFDIAPRIWLRDEMIDQFPVADGDRVGPVSRAGRIVDIGTPSEWFDPGSAARLRAEAAKILRPVFPKAWRPVRRRLSQ